MISKSNFWIEALGSLPSLVTAVTAVVGVIIAARGLNRWRQETIGRRRAELAEDVLAEFYEARDIIQAARSPLSSGAEGSTRKRFEHETEEQTRAWDAYYAIAERLQEKVEFFSKFNARRYRFLAYFGPDAVKPYEEVRGAYNEIIIAVRMLITTSKRPAERINHELIEKWESTIWWGLPEEDKIATRLDDAVAQIERTCRPIIQIGE